MGRMRETLTLSAIYTAVIPAKAGIHWAGYENEDGFPLSRE
jgi:hypothetical protein